MYLQKNANQQWEQTNDYTINVASVDQTFIAKYISKVYAWMCLGLLFTGVIAYLGSNSQALINFVYGSKYTIIGIFILQIGVVMYISARIAKINYATAVAGFLLYAGINGVIFSSIFILFDAKTLISVFAITAGTFAVMSAVGYFTKKDLTSFGRIMMMGLVGIIIASVVNFFMESATLYWIISYVGVAVFVGLIAYDTQKIKSYALIEDAEMRKKASILGALALYLDFINLFIMLLRIFGSRD